MTDIFLMKPAVRYCVAIVMYVRIAVGRTMNGILLTQGIWSFTISDRMPKVEIMSKIILERCVLRVMMVFIEIESESNKLKAALPSYG